jgi:CHAT domain-containing protein
MNNLRTPFRQRFEHLSRNGLQRYLRSLKKDEIVLTYHISPTTAQVWVGQNGKVLRRNIANPAYIYAALQEARLGLANIGVSSFNSKMEALGKRLIGPVDDFLGKTIYWIPAGALLGFPLDALRVNGHYLVENHTVVNLMSFPVNPNPGNSLQTGAPQTVFLAGHPSKYSGDYATRLDTSTEIQAVTDIFVGPGLHIVQGTALLPDEFESVDFQQSDLAHLSMPATIDLSDPQQSSLELSGSESSPGRTLLKPKDITSKKLDADLVFLSASRVKDNPDSGFTSQPGLISHFISAGANTVIARLWASGGSSEETLITGFYQNLVNSGNVASSLTNTKRQYLRDNRESGLYDWAGYQLFID